MYLWLIHIAHQKPAQHCKAIILQLKINLKKVKKRKKIIFTVHGVAKSQTRLSDFTHFIVGLQYCVSFYCTTK